MENLKMHTPDLAEENYRKLAELFPNAVTETITGYDEDGKAIIERAIDADVLYSRRRRRLRFYGIGRGL